MNYPKMLYKGEAKYGDNDVLRLDLLDKRLKTIIVNDEAQEVLRREQGYVDLVNLMAKKIEPKIEEEPKKRGRPKKVIDVSLNPS